MFRVNPRKIVGMLEDPAAGFGMCGFDGSFASINPVKVEGF
jgi:hypothetical protein